MTDSGYPKIIPLNESWAVQEFAPELIIFGSDGGGTAYAFDTRTKPMRIVEVPFIGMSLEKQGNVEIHLTTS